MAAKSPAAGGGGVGGAILKLSHSGAESAAEVLRHPLGTGQLQLAHFSKETSYRHKG